jgi:hypothetical protein
MKTHSHKQHFLDKKDYHAYQISAADLPKIVIHFNKKHNIKIIINGETPLGQDFISRKKKELSDKIALYKEKKLFYIHHLIEYWYSSKNCADNESSFIFKLVEEKETIKNALTAFLKPNGFSFDTMNITLSNIQLQQAKDIISKLPCTEIIQQKYITYLETLLADVSLSYTEVWSEINDIKKSLKDNESVGYVFTNSHRVKTDHFESIVITKSGIIEPIFFSFYAGSEKSLYKPDNFVVSHPIGMSPQSDLQSCGTLSVLYLKELLKDNAEQLNKFCLKFSYYKEGEFGLSHGLIPSPHVLRYSQSEKYNKGLQKMLDDAETFEIITKDNKTIQVKTLKKLLIDSMAKALLLQDSAIYKANKELLEQIPKFKEIWLAEYNKATAKRDKMHADGLNRYLVYRTQRFEARAQSADVKQAKCVLK